MNYNDNTPITFLTVGQLKEVLGLDDDKIAKQRENDAEKADAKKYVYGLRGIRELFGVSHVTAQRYKDTFLRDAVSQQGKVIITNVDKALELFKNHKEGR